MNAVFATKNMGSAVATRRSDRVKIPELGLEDIDVQPRLRKNQWDYPWESGVVFPPQEGAYATFDLSNTVPNHVYKLEFDINYDHKVPESDFENNHLEVTFMRKCP